MPRHLPLRLGAVALAVLALPAIAPAQKFPGNLLAPGYPLVPIPEAAPPAGSKFAPPPAAPRPRPVPAAATPVQADVDADALRLQAEDPPAVVGRVARVSGTTSLRLPGSEDWAPATLNAAIIPGNALWTQPGARAALEAGQAQLFLDGGTALQIDALDERGLRATLAQGSLFLRLAGLETFGGAVDIATPEASIATAIDSRILVEAAAPDGSRPGRVAVFEGGAEVTLANSAEPIRLGPGQAIALAPGGGVPQIEPAGPTTPLMAWALGAEPRVPLPQAVRGMTGATELGLAGRWDRSPEYGEVWYPPVQQDWVPYQDGSWEWRDPWGWTWVDAAPWGFVTGHYGRWARIGPRWGWLPAPVPVAGLPPLRPVWAPALVSFFAPPPRPGYGRPVGWIPLGPREAWYPWYRSSPAYVARVNYRQVPQLAPVRQRWTAWGGPDRRLADGRWGDAPGGGHRDGPRPGGPEDRRFDAYRNRTAATWVPAETMLGSRPVRPDARRADAGLLRQAALAEGPPLRPEPETRGLTARDAERLGLAAAALRAARPDRGAGPPPTVRAALPGPPPGRAGRPEEIGPRGGPGPELRQRLLEDQARRQQARPVPAEETRQRVDRQQELRQRQLDPQPGRRAPEAGERQADKFGQPRQDPMRPPEDQPRRPQEQIRRQQADQPHRQPPDMLREQADQARRQQEQTQRQQMEQSRRQPQDMQRQQADQARRQQEQMQRQQMDQSRRQQQDMQRQQADQARRQQEQMQRQQAAQAHRQQEQMQRQQQRRENR